MCGFLVRTLRFMSSCLCFSLEELFVIYLLICRSAVVKDLGVVALLSSAVHSNWLVVER